MHVVIFEGTRWPTFAPLCLSRPVFSLSSGSSTLLEKQLRYLEPKRLTLWVRNGLAEYCRQHIAPALKIPTAVNQPLDDEPTLLVSGRTLHFGKFEYPNQQAVAIDDDQLVTAALVQRPGLSFQDVMQRTDAWMSLLDLPQMMPQSRMAEYLWDLIGWNEESLVDDAVHNPHNLSSQNKPPGPYHLVNESNVWLGQDVKLAPGCVLDASKGPVMLATGAAIGANSVLLGPCFIGMGAQVMPLSLIRPGTSVGKLCKVAGEISNSIIMGCSNKSHYGFLGDSYLGEWVNLGAGTTTSNLKNTYGNITVHIGSRQIKTERNFLGSMIGDHTKTAIGTRLMTGSYLGYCCMISTTQSPDKFIPSFTFLTDQGSQRYDEAKARQVMQAVFTRRGKQFTPADADLIQVARESAAFVEA